MSQTFLDASGVTFDPAQSVLTASGSGLSSVFYPRSVAVVGATDREGSVGKTILQNLKLSSPTANSQYRIYPVNPTRESVLGFRCFKSIIDVPCVLDLVVIVTPARSVLNLIRECGEASAKTAIVISAGFKEVGVEGLELELQCVAVAKQYGLRLVGPNCLGVMCPPHGLNATFAAASAAPGSLAFISQSGAMCTAVLDWSLKEKIGFSAFVSLGSMADVNFGDLISFLGHDSNTKSILIYMETIGNAASFLSAAKQVASTKPIIVIKAGKTEEAAIAAASHTGSLAGSHDAFLAAMRRVGVLVVDTIGQLFDCALVLGKQPRPKGPNLLIITNAGGPGVLATDATSGSGAKIAKLDEHIKTELDKFLPSAWSHSNPLDILGDATAEVYAKTLKLALEDPNSDGVLVVLSPQSVTEPTLTAKALVDAVRTSGTSKPVLASWMGGAGVAEGFEYLNHNNIPTFAHPDAAAHTFGLIWSQTSDLSRVHELIEVQTNEAGDGGYIAKKILIAAKAAGREILSEDESKSVVESYGIPIAKTIICESSAAAAAAGTSVGFPCVVKLHSETITHKSDVGGVILNVKSAEGCIEAFERVEANVTKNCGVEHFQGVTVQPMLNISAGIELLLGSFCDPQFGPLVVFGSGGCFVEIFKDTATGIPPLSPSMASDLISRTKIAAALDGTRGERFPKIERSDLLDVLVRFSNMVCDLTPYVSELEINPLLALQGRLVALDARVVIRPEGQEVPKLSVLPYPSHMCCESTLKDGTSVSMKPLHSSHATMMKDYLAHLSENSVRQRFLADLSLAELTSRSRIDLLCNADYAREVSLAAFVTAELIGVCRLMRLPQNLDLAELKISVRDDFHGRGVGRLLLKSILDKAKMESITRVDAMVLADNVGFLRLLDGFQFQQKPLKAPANHVYCSLVL